MMSSSSDLMHPWSLRISVWRDVNTLEIDPILKPVFESGAPMLGSIKHKIRYVAA